MPNNIIIDNDFETFGWVSKVQKNRRGTFRLTLNKFVALGCGIEKGQKLFCYLAKDRNNRSIIAIYLDGNPRNKNEEMQNL